MIKIFNKIINFYKRRPKYEKLPTLNDSPWMNVALDEIGVKEVLGQSNNPRIVEYHQYTTLKATNDETPWCSSFTSYCLEKVNIKSTRNAMARSYMEWGHPLPDLQYGCIVVLKRGKGWQGHVGFCHSVTDKDVMILGGNQGYSVCIKEYPKKDIIAIRWPALQIPSVA